MSQPDRIGRYEVESVLRIEPLGRLLSGRLSGSTRAVYIQELCPPATLPAADRERLVRAFEAEGRALWRLPEPRVLRPCDSGSGAADTRYLVFDRPETAGYQPLPSDPRSCSTARWAELAGEICRALAALHAAGIQPVQFEPSSIWISGQGDVLYLHLGWSHFPVRQELPRSLAPPHPLYASPELLAGLDATPSSLTFSVAAWLYVQLSGLPASPAALVAAGRRPDPLWNINREVSASLDDAIQRALHPDPERRYASLREFAEALTGAAPVASPGASASPDEPTLAMQAGTGSNTSGMSLPWQWGAWAAGLAVAGALAGWALAVSLPAPEPSPASNGVSVQPAAAPEEPLRPPAGGGGY